MELIFYTGLTAFISGFVACWFASRHRRRLDRENRNEMAIEFESLVKRHAALKHELRSRSDGHSDQSAEFSRTFDKLAKVEAALEVTRSEKQHAETERDLLRDKLQTVTERATLKAEADQQELEKRIRKILDLEEQLDELKRHKTEAISAGIREHIEKTGDAQTREIEDLERRVRKLDQENKRLETISENLRLEKEHYQKEFMVLLEKHHKPASASPDDDSLKKAG